MNPRVDIAFECLPLRSITRWDIPLDASPELRARCQRIRAAAAKHGLHNSYFLWNGRAEFHLTNDPTVGTLVFRFEGTVLTDATDSKTLADEIHVELAQEACDWLVAPVVTWFHETVRRAVLVEFESYINASDPLRSKKRLAWMEAEMIAQAGFVGMGI